MAMLDGLVDVFDVYTIERFFILYICRIARLDDYIAGVFLRSDVGWLYESKSCSVVLSDRVVSHIFL